MGAARPQADVMLCGHLKASGGLEVGVKLSVGVWKVWSGFVGKVVQEVACRMVFFFQCDWPDCFPLNWDGAKRVVVLFDA